MYSDNSIIQEIFKDLIFKKNEIRIIESVFHKMNVKKGTIIFKSGEIINDMYYIFSGCLRTYHIDSNGKEHTVQFGIKDWWITDFTAFFSSSQALMNLEVLEDATLYRLSSKDREYLNNEFPQIHTFIRKKLEGAYAAFQKRILASLSQSAKDRYVNFINTHPDIEKKVKNYHIASYLGITTESLSRIRKELLKR